MRPYGLVDLHCDTLTDWIYTGTGNPDTIDDPKRVLSLSNIPADVNWAQFYAVFIPDEHRGREAIDYYESNIQNFLRQMDKFSDRVQPCRNAADMEKAWSEGKTAAFLSVENGSVLAGDLSRIELLASQGVRAMTVVWNGENELGSGNTTDHGLSDFGREALKELERNKIIADVSHLNDTGFFQLLDILERPFAATHSNCRLVCSHKRNLTDDMIKEMVSRNCLIGLNYYVEFLEDDGSVDSLESLFRHTAHFLELGAENNLALGSDFDGADLPDCLNSPEKAVGFYAYLLERGVGRKIADGIFWKNAHDFLNKNIV